MKDILLQINYLNAEQRARNLIENKEHFFDAISIGKPAILFCKLIYFPYNKHYINICSFSAKKVSRSL